jgi:hypothetical protein
VKNTIACLAALVVLSASPAVAQKSPERIHLAATSRQGAVLIRVPVQPFSYTLQFSRNGNSGFLSRVYLMKVRAGPPGYTYIARTLSPGRYRLDSVWQQGTWSACLESATIEIPVQAGRIAYVGTLQVDSILEAIQRSAIDRGRTTVAAGDPVVSRPDNVRPIIDGRDEAGFAEAREFADNVMNRSGSLVDLAQVSETAFSTSRTGRLIEVCG